MKWRATVAAGVSAVLLLVAATAGGHPKPDAGSPRWPRASGRGRSPPSRSRPAASTAATSTSRRSRRPTGWRASGCRRVRAWTCAGAFRTGATCRSTPTSTACPPTRSRMWRSRPGRGDQPVPARSPPRPVAARRWRVAVLERRRPQARGRPTRSTRAPTATADRARVPGLRARSRARPDRRNRPAGDHARARRRHADRGRCGLRSDQRRKPRHHGPDDLARAVEGRARRPGASRDQPRAATQSAGSASSTSTTPPWPSSAIARRPARARLAMDADEKGGFYSNRDSAYIYTHLAGVRASRGLHGAVPAIPRTCARAEADAQRPASLLVAVLR